MDYGAYGLKVFEALSPLLLAVLTWAAARLAQYIQAKVKSENLRGVLVRLDDAVLAAVSEVQQVTVDAIKEASPDGKLTPEHQAKVKQAAIDSIKSHLGTKGVAELVQVLGLQAGSIDKLLSTRVEAAVYNLKQARAASGRQGAAGDEVPLAA
jgi:hypothetical protein